MTPEEKKIRRKEITKRYREKHKDEINERHKIFIKNNPQKPKEYAKKFFSKEENKDKKTIWRKKWRENNPERAKELNRNFYKNNPDKVKDSQKRYREKHRDELLLKSSIYKKNNPEKNNENSKKWRLNNLDKSILLSRVNYKRYRVELRDSYIKKLIKNQYPEMSIKDITTEAIESKCIEIIITRRNRLFSNKFKQIQHGKEQINS